MVDLCELSTAKLIKEFKSKPDDSALLSEMNKRLDSGEISDADLIKLLDVILSVGGD